MTAVSVPEPMPHEPSAAAAGAPAAPAFLAPPPPVLAPGQVLFRTLGAAEIHIGGGPVVGPSAERLFTLLVLTAMTPDHVLPRAQLLALVWPDLDESGARHSLRQHLYKLKQLGVPLATTRSTVTLDPRCLVPCFALGRTAELFDRDVLRGHEPFGHLFAGWIPSSLVMRRWVEQQRDRFHMDVRRILLPELHRLRDRADWVECERWARTVLEFDPYNEDATLVLAEAIAMLGGRVNARYMLDGYVRETGVAGTELARHVEATQRRIGRATRVRHEHSATPTLIGRDAELQRLDALTLAAMQGESKVVHLLGPTGIGKTELAYEATRRAVILGFSRCIVRVTRPMGEVPHGMLSRLVRDLLKLPGALGCRPENLTLLRRLAGDDASTAQDLESMLTRVSLVEAIGELVAAIAEEQPLVLFIDEYTLADDQSLAQLESLFDLHNATRTLWLTTSSEAADQSSWRALPKSEATVLKLNPLTLPDAAKLVENVTTPSGRKLSPEDALRIAVATTRTPLQLVTLAREQLTQGIAAPSSARLRDTIAEQFRRLSAHAQNTLHCLTLLGGRSSLRLLDRTLQLRLSERVTAFRELLESGMVSECEEDSLRCHESVANACRSVLTRSERSVLCDHIVNALHATLAEQFDVTLAATALELTLLSTGRASYARMVLELSPKILALGDATVALRYLEIANDLATDPTERRLLLQLQVAAAASSADWKRVLRTSSDFRRLSGAEVQVPVRVELAELEAAVRSDVTTESSTQAERALRLLQSTTLPLDERLQAARVAVGAASDLFDSRTALSAFEALTRLIGSQEASEQSVIEPLMQFHTIFGDPTEAARLASSVSNLALKSDPTPEEARLVLNAAYTLRIGGEVGTAESWLQKMRDARTLQENPRRRAFATWQLALIAADSGDEQKASFWSHRLDAIVNGELGAQDEPWYKLHRLRLELLLTGNIGEPGEALSRVQREFAKPSRSAVYSLALCLHSEQILADRERFELHFSLAQRCLSRYGRYVGNDLLAAGVVSGLKRVGAREQALESLSRYITIQRRERYASVILRSLFPSETFPHGRL